MSQSILAVPRYLWLRWGLAIALFGSAGLWWVFDGFYALVFAAAMFAAIMARQTAMMTRQNASLASSLAAREKESTTRLAVLYHISDQLRADKGLPALFQSAVEMVSHCVGSEESALFLADDQATSLRKVAVAGPDPESTAYLSRIELTQGLSSLPGVVFHQRRSVLVNAIDIAEPHAADYARILPSRATRHYMGAPLRIGDEVMGVIRVINKTRVGSQPDDAPLALDVNGFTTDDLNLLTAIATHIAAAIRIATDREKNRHFEHLVYTSPDPIIVIDGDGRIQNFNRESEMIWGVTERDMVGRSAADLYESPEHARDIGRALWNQPDHTIRAFDTRVRSVDGEIIPMRLSANLLFSTDGKRISSIGVFKDARKMIRDEEVRLRAEKLETIGRLAQATGHDLKHDLGAVLNFAAVLEETSHDDQSTAELYSGIRTAAMSALQKVRNMLLIQDRRAPEMALLSLRSLIDTFARRIEYRVSLANIVFETLVVDDELVILGDSEQLLQVLTNLFGNSLDAIARARDEQPASGIVVRTTVEDGHARIVWSDDGIGVDEDASAQLFTPFFTTKSIGSGLGLYITRSIIERHGGRIRRLPSHGDRGLSLEILLPLHPAP